MVFFERSNLKLDGPERFACLRGAKCFRSRGSFPPAQSHRQGWGLKSLTISHPNVISVQLKDDDVVGLRRVLTGLGRDCIEMREVSPMGGLLPDEERIRVLRAVH
jgi:hypothetical protein